MNSIDAPDGSCSVKATVAWANGNLTADMELLADGKWSYSAVVSDKALGEKEIKLRGEGDTKTELVGPLDALFDSMKMEDIGKLAAPVKGKAPEGWGGEVRNIRLRLDPVSVASNKPLVFSASVTGDLIDAALVYGGNSFEKLDGKFKLAGAMSADEFTCGAEATLTSYSALLYGGGFLVPKPPAGTDGKNSCWSDAAAHGTSGKIECAGQSVQIGRWRTRRILRDGRCVDWHGRAVIFANCAMLNLSFRIWARRAMRSGRPNLKNREPWFGRHQARRAGALRGRAVLGKHDQFRARRVRRNVGRIVPLGHDDAIYNEWTQGRDSDLRAARK